VLILRDRRRTQRRGHGQRTRLHPDRRMSRSAPRPQSAPRHRLEGQPQRRCRRRGRRPTAPVLATRARRAARLTGSPRSTPIAACR
jgi:hypothetical protein